MTKSTAPLSRRELLAGAALFSLTRNAWSQSPPEYDLLLKGGHVIDPKNRISAVRDVAVHQGKVAAVATAEATRSCTVAWRRRCQPRGGATGSSSRTMARRAAIAVNDSTKPGS